MTTPQTASDRISLRLSPSVLERLDKLIPNVSETVGMEATRSDVVREALMIGLRQLENGRAK